MHNTNSARQEEKHNDNEVAKLFEQLPQATLNQNETELVNRNWKVSPRGYDFFQLLSALQKDIRRENEKQALRWAIELESMGGKALIALWNRLKIIASEDIGPANQLAPLIVNTLEIQYNQLKKASNSKKPERLPLVNAVLFLSSSLKSRVIDNLLAVVYGERDLENWNPPIPDYAIDKHTLKGKRKGAIGEKGIEVFFEEGTKLYHEAIEDPYRDKAKDILIKKERGKQTILFPIQRGIT
jgi:replication-associated recombination protein RarA